MQKSIMERPWSGLFLVSEGTSIVPSRSRDVIGLLVLCVRAAESQCARRPLPEKNRMSVDFIFTRPRLRVQYLYRIDRFLHGVLDV